MPGKLPIDRVRARTIPAHPYEDVKQTFTRDQVNQDGQPQAPRQPSASVSSERIEECDQEGNDA